MVTKRGPYKKSKDDEFVQGPRKNKKVLTPCRGYNDRVRCDNLIFRHEYCGSHQHLLPIWKQLPCFFICDCCNEEIGSNKSEIKTVCKTCARNVCVKCKVCGEGTINTESELCRKHVPNAICCIETCTQRAHHGTLPLRYCSWHTPTKKCTHIGTTRVCKRAKTEGQERCCIHGGIKVTPNSVIDTEKCGKLVLLPNQPCKEKIKVFREDVIDRIIDTTKCSVHGGIVKCYVCDKKACVGIRGTCEDHGGVVCTECDGPVYIKRSNGKCHNCKNESKVMKCKLYNEKIRCIKNTTT